MRVCRTVFNLSYEYCLKVYTAHRTDSDLDHVSGSDSLAHYDSEAVNLRCLGVDSGDG